MTPAALCADCHAPLAPALARATDRGWTCADDPLCAAITHRLATTRQEAAVPKPNQHQPVTAEEERRIVELYEDGNTICEVAGIVGRSDGLVRRVLRDHRVLMRRAGRRKQEQRPTEVAAPAVESIAYTGGWVVRGGVLRPTEPVRGVAA